MKTLSKNLTEKYLPNHRVRKVANAKLIHSEWGYHLVEFNYQTPLDNYFVKLGLINPDAIKTSQIEFTTKSKALEFINVVPKNI